MALFMVFVTSTMTKTESGFNIKMIAFFCFTVFAATPFKLNGSINSYPY